MEKFALNPWDDPTKQIIRSEDWTGQTCYAWRRRSDIATAWTVRTISRNGNNSAAPNYWFVVDRVGPEFNEWGEVCP